MIPGLGPEGDEPHGPRAAGRRLNGIPEASPLDMPGLYAGPTAQSTGASIATTTSAVRSHGWLPG